VKKHLISQKSCGKVLTSSLRKETKVMRNLTYAAEYFYFSFFYNNIERAGFAAKKSFE